VPPLPPDLGAGTIKRIISRLRPLSITYSAFNWIKVDGVLFKIQDKRHFNPQKWSTWMHAIFNAYVVLYMLAVSGINFARNVFLELRIGTAFITLILKKVENKEAGTSAAQTYVFETSLKVFRTTALF
jgi:hypothetical protein